MTEDKYDDLLHFVDSPKFTDREKVALTYASSIVWNADIADEALWAKLHQHFSNPELVELGFFIALTLGAAAVDQDARHRAPRGAGRYDHGSRAEVRGQSRGRLTDSRR